jgi:hypothetical protein
MMMIALVVLQRTPARGVGETSLRIILKSSKEVTRLNAEYFTSHFAFGDALLGGNQTRSYRLQKEPTSI